MRSTPTVNNDIAYPSVAKLRWRYTIALSLIAFLVVISQLIMQSLLSSQKYDSNVINIAGSQRMLSQKVTKLSYYILTAESEESADIHRNELNDVVALWEKSHRGLIHGDDALNLPDQNSETIVNLFNKIDPYYKSILHSAKKIVIDTDASELRTQIKNVSVNESYFLTGMNKIVYQYAKEAKARVNFAGWVEISLMILTIIVLVLEFVFIFSPAANSLQSNISKLTKNKNDLQNLFAASPISMLLVDPADSSILQVNEKAISLIGSPFSKGKVAKLNDYLDGSFENNDIFINKLKNGIALNEHEIVILNTKGSMNETLISVRSITFNEKPTSVIGITNISELKKAQKELFHYASFDDMTGLLNRRAGLLFLEKAMRKIDSDNTPLLVCYIDLDGLKHVNDKYGHAEGDWLIQTASQVLNNFIGTNNAGIRLGGDEFLLILHDYSVEDVERLIAKIEKTLEGIRSQNKKPFPLAFSFGIATYTLNRDITPDELISESDNLMYQSKQAKKHNTKEDNTSV